MLDYLRSSGLQVFAATEKAEHTVYQTDLTGPAAIIFGAEDVGISKQLFQQVDQSISIPQYGTIASLNVSVATGIVLYEAVRQRMA